MKRYRPYRAKRFRLPKRMIFFAVAAAILFGLAVLLGNDLKRHLENADINREPIDAETTASAENEKEPMPEGFIHDETMLTVYSGNIPLDMIKDEAKMKDAVTALKTEGYNSVSVTLSDSDGMLAFASKSLEQYTKMKASEALVTADMLKAAVSYASSLGMSSSAVLMHGDIETDKLIISDISEAGFSDLTLLGFSGDSFDRDTLDSFKSYLSELRVSVGMRFGICLDPGFFLDAANSADIEKLYAVSDYLAMDMRGYSAEKVAEISDALKGSFAYYMIRPLVSPDTADTSDAIKGSLKKCGIGALQMYSAPAAKPATDTERSPTDTDNKKT